MLSSSIASQWGVSAASSPLSIHEDQMCCARFGNKKLACCYWRVLRADAKLRTSVCTVHAFGWSMTPSPQLKRGSLACLVSGILDTVNVVIAAAAAAAAAVLCRCWNRDKL